MKIDIIVPTFNRPNDVIKFVEEIKKQNYENYKVFIIDDCSTEEIESLIPKNDHNFYYERLEENSGQAFARNYATSLGSGDIIIFMDDDAYFTEKNGLELIASYFKENKNIGFVMFNIKEPNRNWLNERKDLVDLEYIGNFIACGCAFRRDAFNNCNGFKKEFHSYAEETDISMQLIKNSVNLVFASRVKVFHNYNPGQRNKEWLKRFKFNSVRNDLAIVLTRYPTLYIVPHFIGKVLSHILYSIYVEKHTLLNINCIFKGVIASFSLAKKLKRNPLTIKQYKYWKSIRF